jgi:hypothetical protein
MSSHAVFFVQECPTCGRRLRVCVEYLGKTIQCRHCRGILMARDPEAGSTLVDPQSALMRRVDELLTATEELVPQSARAAIQRVGSS